MACSRIAAAVIAWPGLLCRFNHLRLRWFAKCLWVAAILISGERSGAAAEPIQAKPIDQCGVTDFVSRVRNGGAQIVIVGISEYADKQISSRRHAEADAIALYELFVDEARFGVLPKQVQLLLGDPKAVPKSQQATRANILRALNQAVINTGDDELLIFAFFGQGASLGRNGSQVCYLASNSTVARRAADAISDSDLTREFNRLGAPRVCAFIDVYFKGIAEEISVPEPDPGALTFRSIGVANRDYRDSPRGEPCSSPPPA
jgi:hypothetical protein